MLPSISILMPIRNEACSIGVSLAAILDQDYPPEKIEVLVADGMSTDGTREIISKFEIRNSNFPIHIIDNPGKIVPTGMNAALRQARGEIILRVDGHTVIAPDYVRRCVEALQESGADNAGGKMNAAGQGAFGEAAALATSSPFGVGGARFHYSDREEWVDTVYMGAWRREVFERIGLFDEELVRDQDDEFNYRLREQGGRILLSPRIKSTYTVRSTPKALWRQYYQYGYWKVRVLQKHPRQMSLRQFVPPIFSASVIFSALLAFTGKDFGFRISDLGFRNSKFEIRIFLLPLMLVLGAYVLANLAASTYTAARRGWRHLARLPLIYAILHLGYGLGFLIGMVKFWHRWGDKTGHVPIKKPVLVE
jgi:succinoglycan biosynthesis protein ExoA